jgi:hypothetical protein
MGDGLSGRAQRLRPVPVAAFGAVVVALLLIWPISSTVGGGDHATPRFCGNAFSVDVSRWHNPQGEPPYQYLAYQDCTTEQVKRVALAVCVLAAALLGVTVFWSREQWRPDPAKPPH